MEPELTERKLHPGEHDAAKEGTIMPEDLSKVPKEPYPLIDGFEWVTMDMNDKSEVRPVKRRCRKIRELRRKAARFCLHAFGAPQIDDVYQLLFHNYVEDDEAMFRFKYSSSFLNWYPSPVFGHNSHVPPFLCADPEENRALKSPGWRKEWHVGIRASTSRKLVAFISGVPITLRVRGASLRATEINFLCVHKKLRAKRLAPVLIREMTRRCNVAGIWQAIYTAGVLLPTPVSTCRYYHRALDWTKLHEVGFSPLPPGSTPQRQVLRNRLPPATGTPGLRQMVRGDCAEVLMLLKRYLQTVEMVQEFSKEEFEHWLLNDDADAADRVVYAYVVEVRGRITDFFSFYTLESTVMNNAKHDTIRAAYMFYYATDVAFAQGAADSAALKKRLNALIKDALILAKKVSPLHRLHDCDQTGGPRKTKHFPLAPPSRPTLTSSMPSPSSTTLSSCRSNSLGLVMGGCITTCITTGRRP